ncbi:hypothetical protein SBI_01937 [Streptomyces bingchenggensis BCW-1]|uniref:Uncharacterized protein n=1 Tax=Streptomyces bingchenggensis (strain BCW-1) TaxID=749414 RepID=D7BQ51_STRBB|nr:hypothetical protein SBI_01937 [Streptomyces bingchenggensis BCW-1]
MRLGLGDEAVDRGDGVGVTAEVDRGAAPLNSVAWSGCQPRSRTTAYWSRWSGCTIREPLPPARRLIWKWTAAARSQGRPLVSTSSVCRPMSFGPAAAHR